MDKNIPLFKVFMSPEVGENVANVLNSGFIGQGSKVKEFENLLENKFGKKVLSLNSCTSAIHLALRLIKDSPGDEIISSPLTCSATNVTIPANNYKIKWADVDLNTCNIDLDDVERKLSKNTKALLFVHWGGYPVDLDRVADIQEKCRKLYGHKPPVIEDCAHVWGSEYKDKLIGTHGNFCAFSFQAIKHLTTGDGGMLICPTMLANKEYKTSTEKIKYRWTTLGSQYGAEAYYEKGKLLRWFGLDRESSADFRCSQNPIDWGYKFHMNDINATIGIHNYPKVDNLVQKHMENADYYNNELKNVVDVTLLENKHKSSYWIYTLRVKNREKFKDMMAMKGIMVSQVHSRNDVFDCFKEYKCSLPNMDILHQDMISIPCGWWVNEEDRKYIVETIKGGW